MITVPTIQRRTETYTGFRLDTTTSRLRIPVNSGESMTITGRREFGSSWSSYVIRVQRVSPGDSVAYDFASTKTISHPGGAVSISSSEMEGVSELELNYSAGAVETSGTTAFFTVVVQTPVQTLAEGVGVRTLTSSGSQPDSPEPPSE